MCGIAGIIRITPPDSRMVAEAMHRPPAEAIPEHWLDILDDSIKHRGPDGAGRFRDRATRSDGAIVDVALVHRRMAIIDIADGAQPMVSARGRTEEEGLVAVVFNGCIYNHRELRAELQRAGHQFVTNHSDTEVLVHGWREWNSRLFENIEGMFACALWSRGHGLTLSVDHYGEKPLWLARWRIPEPNGRGLAYIYPFASSASALLRLLPLCPGAIESSGAVLRGASTPNWIQFGYGGHMLGLAERVGFAVEALGSSSTFTFELNSPNVVADKFEPRAIRGRWMDRHDKTRPPRPDTPSVDAVETSLVRAVCTRLDADVPVGCFLSGGVDSSLIAAIAQRHAGGIRTFTIAMPDQRFDESRIAERVAKIIGSNHQTLPCHPEPAADLVALIQQIGIPFGDSSLLPTHWVSRAAREHVKVALSGDGADELFAGYDRIRACRVLRSWHQLLRYVPTAWLRGAHPKSWTARFARLCEAARGDGYDDLVSIFPHTDRKLLLGLPGIGSMQVRPKSARARRAFSGIRDLFTDPERALAMDLRRYLPGDLLRKLDSAAMAVALETRCPYLDTELASLVRWARLDVLMPHGQRKGLLRAVARKYLPAEIVDRPKMGFAIPIGEWFRSDYGGMRQLLYDHLESTEPWGPESLGISSTINMAFVRQMLKEHDDAGRGSFWPWKGRDHGQRLYMLLVLSIWAKWLGRLGIKAES